MREHWSGQDVLALVVANPASEYVERTLVSLLTQTVTPSRILIGLREGEPSDIKDFLRRVNAPDSVSVCELGAIDSFFDGCARMADGSEPWLWLLHDDSAPEAHALEYLLEQAGREVDVGIVGAKQVNWDNPRELVEVGIRATRSARRIPEIESGELDQGQYDERFEVLAVGSAGMCVRREALEAAGGFDTSFGPFGDGLELSRRVRAAGYLVTVAPLAKVRHVRGSLGEDERDSFVARRVAQIHNSLIAAPTLVFPVALLAYILLGFARAVGRIVTKEPALAVGEIRAAVQAVGATGSVLAARRRLREVSVSKRGRSFTEYPHTVRTAKREARRATREAAIMADVPDPIAVRAEAERLRKTRRFAWISAALALVVGLVGQLPRLASHSLTGGALVTDFSTASEIASFLTKPWLPSGDGFAASVDPFWGWLTPLAAAFRSLGAGASWLVLLAVPLAAVIAYACAGSVITSPYVRAAGALAWAFAPPLLDAVNAGHVAGIVVHLAAPALMAAIASAWAGSVAGLGGASLLFALVASANPGLLLAAFALAVIGYLRRAGGRWRWLALPVPALVLLLPTLICVSSLDTWWRLAFATPGLPVPIEASALSLLSFSPLGQVSLAELVAFKLDALARIVPALVLLALAVLALVRPHRYRIIRLGWLLVAVGWLWAMLASFTQVAAVSTPTGYTLATGWSGIGLTIAFGGLWLVLVSGADGLMAAMRNPATKTGAVLLAVLGTAAPAVLGGYWLAGSLLGEASMLAVPSRQAPALAEAEADSPAQARLLALRPSEGGIETDIWRGDGLQLHETSMVLALAELEAAQERGPLLASREDIVAALAALPVGSPDLAATLAQHAISVVLVPADIDEAQAHALIGELNANEGLEFVAHNETGYFWRVAPASGDVARLTIVDEAGATALPAGAIDAEADVPAGEEERILALAERADKLWRATCTTQAGTRSLAPAGSQWNQQWVLPAEECALHVEAGGLPWRILTWGQGAVVLAAAIAALPVKRRGGRREPL